MADEETMHGAAEMDDTEVNTATAVEKKPAPSKREPGKLPPFKVLLHNDDVSTVEHVIRSIVQLTAIPAEEAVVKTLEAHETGVALLLVTHRERAELYVEQFASLDITTTMEPDEG